MDSYIGTICVFGFNFAPRNWAFCNGQLIAIASNTALFSLLGTTYGGNGTSTFALPNLQGRVANHQGNGAGLSSYVMGELAGSDTVTILSSNMPSHNHALSMSLNANAGASTSNNPSGTFPGLAGGSTKLYNSAATSGVFMANPTVTLGASGATIPMTISNPTLVMNYCIALYGIYPARN